MLWELDTKRVATDHFPRPREVSTQLGSFVTKLRKGRVPEGFSDSHDGSLLQIPHPIRSWALSFWSRYGWRTEIYSCKRLKWGTRTGLQSTARTRASHQTSNIVMQCKDISWS